MLCITKKNNTFGNKGIPRTAEEMVDIFKIKRINILGSGVGTARIVFEIRGRHQAEKRIIEMKRLLDAVERIENGEDVNEARRSDNIDAVWLADFVGGSSSFLPSYKQTACNLENQETKSRFIHKLFGYGYYPLINFDESFEKLQKLLTPREYGILEMLVMKGQTEDAIFKALGVE